MPAQQVKQVLELVRGFHAQTRGYYDRLDAEAQAPRVKLLLEYLAGQEQRFDETLREFEEVGEPDLLEAWINFLPEEPFEKLLATARFDPNVTVDDVVEQALRFQDALCDFCRVLAEEAPLPRLQEMFANLAHMERVKERRMSTQAARSDDF